MYPQFNPQMPQGAQDQINARRPAFPQAGGMPQTFPGSGAFQGQGGPFSAGGAPGAPGAFPGQAPNGFQGQGGPFAPAGVAHGAPQTFPGPSGFAGQGGPFAAPGMGQMAPQGGMNTQVMPPNYQQGMNQAMRPPMPSQAQNQYLAANLGFGRR